MLFGEDESPKWLLRHVSNLFRANNDNVLLKNEKIQTWKFSPESRSGYNGLFWVTASSRGLQFLQFLLPAYLISEETYQIRFYNRQLRLGGCHVAPIARLQCPSLPNKAPPLEPSILLFGDDQCEADLRFQLVCAVFVDIVHKSRVHTLLKAVFNAFNAKFATKKSTVSLINGLQPSDFEKSAIIEELAAQVSKSAVSIIKQAKNMTKREGSKQRRECNTMESFKRCALQRMRLITDESKLFGISFWMPDAKFDDGARDLGQLPREESPNYMLVPQLPCKDGTLELPFFLGAGVTAEHATHYDQYFSVVCEQVWHNDKQAKGGLLGAR